MHSLLEVEMTSPAPCPYFLDLPWRGTLEEVSELLEQMAAFRETSGGRQNEQISEQLIIKSDRGVGQIVPHYWFYIGGLV